MKNIISFADNQKANYKPTLMFIKTMQVCIIVHGVASFEEGIFLSYSKETTITKERKERNWAPLVTSNAVLDTCPLKQWNKS